MSSSSSGSKHDVLTEAELARFRPSPRTLHYLERHRQALGRPPQALRVLDWGCGRGRTVLALRERGFDAFGVDVDPEPLERGRPLLRQRGHPPDALRLLSPDGSSDFDAASFDFVCSDQVLEHVADLGVALREQRRLLAPGGVGFHQYPGHRRPVEVHLDMPLVHWLPKSELRHAAIRFWVRRGREPHWDWLEGRSATEKAAAYFDYSVRHTYYRPFGEVRRAFEAAGFRVSFETLHHPGLDAWPGAARAARQPALRPLVSRLLWTFFGVELLASAA